MHKAFSIALTIGLFLASVNVSLGDDGADRVRFKFGDDEFISRLQFPEQASDETIMIGCSFSSVIHGRVFGSSCFTTQQVDADWIKSIEIALGKTRVTTARWNGKRRQNQHTVFRLVFSNDQGERSVQLFHNLGLNQASYGDEYFAPQLIFIPDSFSSISSDCKSLPAMIELDIDEGGIVSNFNAVGDYNSLGCQKSYEKFIKRFDYIPAEFNGKHVSAKHVYFN